VDSLEGAPSFGVAGATGFGAIVGIPPRGGTNLVEDKEAGKFVNPRGDSV